MTGRPLVVVTFKEPTLVLDVEDGVSFLTTRHKVDANWARQDGIETIFLNDDGEIVGSWPTNSVESIQWPTGKSTPATAEGIKLRRDEILLEFPRAWSKRDAKEDAKLTSEFHQKDHLAAICKQHQRTEGSICLRLSKLALVPAELDR